MPGGPTVVDYDPRWPDVFERLRRPIASALAGLRADVEHVGSTAVPGLAAKPIIDIDVVVSEIRRLQQVIARLEGVGYRHQGDLGLAGREAFAAPPDLPEHHLYAVVRGNDAHQNHVLLRDHLRSHPDAAQRYAARKRELADVLAHDRTAYGEAKAGIVTELLRAAREERRRQPPASADRG
ncbi:MAG: GrpB family protein [Candidatus Dormiibacterota bacterium]